MKPPNPWIRPLCWGLTGVALAGPWALPSDARACGGFFCSQSAPVNQAAERIIFADNGDGTVTAIIQIMYEGPSESFSWLLPISSVPQEGDIGVASDLAFQRLQSATNPQYTLTTRIEGECSGGSNTGGASNGAGTGGFAPGLGSADAGTDSGVTVEASGVVGPFDWTVISFDESLPDAADAATTWLEENGYDVGEGAPGLIRPYLQDGLNLLALRLTKGVDAGSIRPLRLTYAADRPMIPIKLTAVAANEDMGVMTWLLSSARAVPQNYLSLELNEARINWFNASANYADVVTAAADEAGGQGFVTEYADATSTLSQTVWSDSDEQNWQSFRSARYTSFQTLFEESFWRWNSFDGYWDAVRSAVTLPADVAFEDFKICPDCYAERVELSPTGFMQALEEQVIEPTREVQALIDAYPYVTRLYTTMSAEEMTVDPLFTFNPDLSPVSNLHTAERVIECTPSIDQFEAPWRIELPQGGVIRGTADQVGSWPDEVSVQPSNLRIRRLSESGAGVVLEDNGDAIEKMLSQYNAGIAGGRPGADAGSNGGSSGGSTSSDDGSGSAADPTAGAEGMKGQNGGCNASGTGGAGWGLLAMMTMLLGLAIRRRKLLDSLAYGEIESSTRTRR